MKSEVIEMRPKGSFLEKGFRDFCNFLKERNVKRILEIGSYAGESLKMYKEILGEDVFVVCIDPYDTLDDENDLIHNADFSSVEATYNQKLRGMSRVVKCKAYSQDQELLDMIADEFFDCVYIDGLHTYEQVKLDIGNYHHKLRKGGILAGHDYAIEYTQQQMDEIIDFEGNDKLRKAVSKAVVEMVGKPDLTFGDSTWVKEW